MSKSITRPSEETRYVYTVLSRRSGGLSVGINLNPNNACNWRCVYCQVPDLVRGAGPVIDLEQLREELTGVIGDIQSTRFHQRHGLDPLTTPIRDIAFAGNGEPTSTPSFPEAIATVGGVAAEFDLLGRIPLVLITNGSQMQKDEVQRGLAHWAELGGQIWFKIDRGRSEDLERVNSIHLKPDSIIQNLDRAARLCPTWIQSCFFEMDGAPPDDTEVAAYLGLLAKIRDSSLPVEGILLYGLDRPSNQPEAERLKALPKTWLEALGKRIEALGLTAKIYS